MARLVDRDDFYGSAARPAVQLPILVVCLLAGLFAGWVAVAILGYSLIPLLVVLGVATWRRSRTSPAPHR